MQRIFSDLRAGMRQLKNSPGFALVAVTILALGIGATTAMYTLIDQALVRALPVRNPGRLVQLRGSRAWEGHTYSYGGDPADYFSWPMYRKLRDQNQVFSGMLAATPAQVALGWRNHAEMEDAELDSGNYFEVLGLQAALGRLLLPSDDRQVNGSPVAVLSFTYWQQHFAADPRVLNQTVRINSHPFTIVGVAPPGFHSVLGGTTPAVFTPMTMKPEVLPGTDDLENAQSRWLNILARLKPGMTRTQAQAGLQPLWHALRAAELAKIANPSPQFRAAFLDKSVLTLRNGARGFSPIPGEIRTPFLLVLFMAALVLLMACANVAGLLLVRAAGRAREMSVRYALGARRSQIAGQLLTEGLVLGVAGGALGLWLAPRVGAVLERRILDQSTGELPFSTHPDGRMLVFTIMLSIGVSLLFSLAPVLQFWRPDVTPALKQAAPSVSGGSLGLQRMAVGVQIGLSVLLLTAAGLFTRTLYNLKSVNLGFQTDHLIQFRVDPQLAGYSSTRVPALYQAVLERLRALPGVRAAGATSSPVMIDWTTGFNITIPGYDAPDKHNLDVNNADITPGYFSALQIPLLAGRRFTDADNAHGAKVSIVNETFARRYFGSASRALGHAWGIGFGDTAKTDIQIVGVVRDSQQTGVRNKISPMVFLPAVQRERPEEMAFYVRTWQPPEAAMATVRGAMRDLDPRLVLNGLEAVRAQVNDNLDLERTVALLAISFGILALLISAVGLYALLAYATAQRTREIGLRMALGASRAAIAGMVLWDTLRLAVTSLAVALPAAWLLTRWVRSELYGVSGHDPLTLAVVAGTVLTVSTLAAGVPVLRAIGVDPMVALRQE